MRYTPLCLVLTFLGWLSSGGSSALAHDTPWSLLHTSSEATATATHPGAAPTPQFLRVTIGLEAGGRTIRLRYDPVWVALTRPQVRVGEAPTTRAPAEGVVPPPQDGVDALDRALEQVLAHTQPAAVPSP